MKIVITGSSGFVGSNLINFFKLSLNELSILNLRNPKWRSEIEIDATAIIHLAGKAHDVKNSSNPEEYFEINTRLTQDLFDAFLVSNCRDFIFFQ
jgi:nucleoside-diphosphate-sugar epimerase